MSFTTFQIEVLRKTPTRLPDGSETFVEAAVPGGPFAGRFYRAQHTNVNWKETGIGTVTVDKTPVVSFTDPSTPVQIGDVVIVPAGSIVNAETRALIQRIRVYDTLQCDLELGTI